MRFSDAIREGSKRGPQGFGFGRYDGSLCATEAAVTALGYNPHDLVGENPLGHHYPELKLPATCPACGEYGLPQAWGGMQINLGEVIALHLNDNHRWTREQIADWYEATFEQPQQTDDELVAATVAKMRVAAEPEMVMA